MSNADFGGPEVLRQRPRTQRVDEGFVRAWGPAKINLNLLVGPRGRGGFHPVDSYVSKITLYDQLDIHLREDGEINLETRGADCGPDQQNLVLMGARLLAEDRKTPGADLLLTKHIPPQKGLGGGSSDAVAALRGLNELWDLELKTGDLVRLTRRLGSDVSLFLGPRSSRITGRGEHVYEVPVHPFFAVLLLPEFSCRTADVYEGYDNQAVPIEPQIRPYVMATQPPSAWTELLRNQLATAAKQICPQLTETWTRFSDSVDLPVYMSGSGSALFVLCDTRDQAISVLTRIPTDLREECIIVQQNKW